MTENSGNYSENAIKIELRDGSFCGELSLHLNARV